MPLPNLIVVGAMKCGTTSLHRHLARHPEVFMARDKELNFFSDERRWKRGTSWYESCFEHAPVRGETSPNYTKYPLYPEAIPRLAATLPDARLVYIVRDPVRRTLSHFHHALCDDLEERTLEAAFARLDPADNHYVRCSLYAAQLHRVLDYVPPERVHVVDLHELNEAPASTLSRLYDFLEITDVAVDHVPVANASATKGRRRWLRRRLSRLRGKTLLKRTLPESVLRKIDAMTLTAVPYPRPDTELETRLRDAFRSDVATLREISGRPFASWSL